MLDIMGMAASNWLVAGTTLLSAVLCAAATVMLAPVSRREGPLWLVGTQAVLAVLGLLPIVFLRLSGREHLQIDWVAGMIFLCVVAPLLGGGAVFFYTAAEGIGVSRAFSISSSYPLFTTLAGVLFLGERPTGWVVVGTLAVLAGVSIISTSRASAEWQPQPGLPLFRHRGFWYAVLAGLCWASGISMMKVGLARGADPLLGNLLRMPGVAVLVALALWLRKEKWSLRGIARRSWVALLVATLLDKIVGDVLYVWSLQAGTLSAVVPLAATAPMWVVLLAWSFLRERPSWALVIGVVLSVAGMAAIVA